MIVWNNIGWTQYMCRADSRFAPSQWETALLCNDVSHWLGASLESALHVWFKTIDDRSWVLGLPHLMFTLHYGVSVLRTLQKIRALSQYKDDLSWYGDSYIKDKRVARPYFLKHGDSCSSKTASLYWDTQSGPKCGLEKIENVAMICE